ncbi:DUF6114 domain-containing protein [Streptoalloteichus hindustanus]|uniref:Uncharacterized protein n=1 Tax=Streptoalloteichus hindustanus TaxID=2017 RepID=A0A1M5GJH3_STRHI|nr:DUF6114 domain-containing protein [Streptoalloteichus hindustanus]SHG03826.1 hypothetical protein SAMN05444320_106146 [Streptoalloteichus hindustanus]
MIATTVEARGRGADPARTEVLPARRAAPVPAVRPRPSALATVASTRRRFRTWRRDRPFWAGVFLLASGVIILAPPYATLRIGDLTLAMGTIGGVSSLVIGALMIVSGLSLWVRPQFRLAAGVAAMLLALVSLVTANLGGFIVGAVLGVLGSALAVSWTDQSRVRRPRRARQRNPAPSGHDAPRAETTTPLPAPTAEQVITQTVVEAAERSAAPRESDPREPTPRKPGPWRAPDDRPSPSPRRPPSTLVVALLAVAGVAALVAASPDGVAVAGGRPPATATTTPASPGTPTSPAPTPGPPTSGSSAPGSTGASTTGSTSGTPQGSGSSAPAPSTAPSGPTASAALPTNVSPPPTVRAGPGRAAVRPFTLAGTKLTLYGASFDGVTDVPTLNGTKRALAFRVVGVDVTDMVMTADAGEGRKMTVRAAAGSVTTIRGLNVVLHTERLVGKLDVLGIPIPVDFSPDNPPPLTLPLLTFKDVTVTNAQQLGGTLTIPGATIGFG